MNRYFQILGLVLFLFTISIQRSVGQTEENTLDTERVVIVKAYTPTISDAFKQKTVPVIEDSIIAQKKSLEYRIFSVPVASTFTPAKGKAAAVEAPKKVKLFDNHATLGFGNFGTLLGEFYSTIALNRTDDIAAYFRHRSSQGGIDAIALDDSFYNTALDVSYTSRGRKMTYGANLGVEHQLYNWYGLPSQLPLSIAEFEMIDPQQNYYGATLGGNITFKDSYVKDLTARYRYFGDAFQSTEHRATITPKLTFEIADERFNTTVHIDYLSGSFERDLFPGRSNTYSILNAGITPVFVLIRDQFAVHLGASFFHSADLENQDHDLFFYPHVTASYQLLDEMVVAFGGVEGGLIQNTYRDAVQQNPFVSPTLPLAPTHQQLDAYAGLKGKVANVLSYTIKAGYSSEEDKPLFVHNLRPAIPQEGFDYGNSFSYRYDDVTTITAHGALHFDLSSQFSVGLTGTFAQYSTDREAEAWNLPEVEATFQFNYQITPQWYVGFKTLYMGTRKDIDNSQPFTIGTPQPTVTLDAYFDVNTEVKYAFNDRWSVFLRGNNLLGKNYERWADTPVQGIQVLAGATYKFDF